MQEAKARTNALISKLIKQKNLELHKKIDIGCLEEVKLKNLKHC